MDGGYRGVGEVNLGIVATLRGLTLGGTMGPRYLDDRTTFLGLNVMKQEKKRMEVFRV